MPIYEYRCNRCKKEFSHLLLNPKAVVVIKCKFCSGTDLTRLLSTFCVHQTEDSRVADFDASTPRTDGFYKDSRNIGLWAKKKMKQMGVELGPKFEEIVEKGRTGKILDEYGK